MLGVLLLLTACFPPPNQQRIGPYVNQPTPQPTAQPATQPAVSQPQVTPPGQVIPGQLAVFQVGGRQREWTTPRYFRANVYRATRNATITEFQTFLGLPQQGCTLGFHAYMSQRREGPYTPIWSTQRYSAGTGYHTSGPMQIQTIPGMFYTLGAGWDCRASYYSGTYGTANGRDVGFGYFEGNAWSNSYQGYNPSFAPSNNQFADSANYDQVISVIPR